MKIILVGNANCGKTTLFNALTHSNEKTGNWHGVTVGKTCKKVDLGNGKIEICDLPGIYSLKVSSLEEKQTKQAILKDDYDLVIAVADAVTLTRSIRLPLEIKKQNKRVLLVVTMADVLKKQGGYINEENLSKKLGMPVVVADPRSKKSVAKIRNEIINFSRDKDYKYNQTVNDTFDLKDAYKEGDFKGGFVDFLLFNPFTAYAIFIVLMFATFFLAFHDKMLGVFIKGKIEFLIGEKLCNLAVSSLANIGAHPAIISLIKDAFFSGSAMLLSFVPQILIVQAVLVFLEESGYMSTLAFMTDGIFSKAGLSGRATFSLVLGFGCSAAAILSTRGLEDKEIQKRTVLILPYISCSAKMPVYLALISAFFKNQFAVLIAVYITGVLISIFTAFMLKNLSKPANFILEIPHLQIPKPTLILKSLLFYLKQFIIKIATVVTVFLIVIWFLLSFDFSLNFVGQGSDNCILRYLCEGLKYLFYPMGIKDWRIALSAVSGLIAKESVAGTLGMFYGENLASAFSAQSALAFIAFILTTTPCVSAIAATAKELGKKKALKYAVIQSGIAFLVGYVVYFALTFSVFVVVLAIVSAFAVIIIPNRKGKHIEKIHRRRKSKT